VISRSLDQPREDWWRARLERFGHTGWKDPVVYAFDQLERLEIVRGAIPAAGGPQQSAIDFGCGTGDFSRLLLDLGYAVVGYDPFVEPTLDSPRFRYVADLERLREAGRGSSLALSVTALDHVLDPSEFLDALTCLRACLLGGGRLVALEYALDIATERRSGPGAQVYQAFRTVDEWRSALEATSFAVSEMRPVPHPGESPSPGYRAYRRHWSVRLWELLRRLRLPADARWLRRAASRAMAAHRASDPHQTASPLKLIIAHART
jgi:SAM-dependent methyltransferase